MEEDRAQVDLGIAADMEANQEQPEVSRIPKKRFVGRRQAAENAAKDSSYGTNNANSDAIQGRISQLGSKSFMSR